MIEYQHDRISDRLKCSRCKQGFQIKHPLQNICDQCIEANPKLTSEEKSASNIWDNIELLERIVEIAKAAKQRYEYLEPEEGGDRDWCWARNTQCKYLNIRVDMRDGGCIVSDSSGRIGIDALNWQYSKETPERPKT